MDSRFLKFFVLFYAHNKYSERHCGIYLRLTFIFGDMSRVGIPVWQDGRVCRNAREISRRSIGVVRNNVPIAKDRCILFTKKVGTAKDLVIMRKEFESRHFSDPNVDYIGEVPMPEPKRKSIVDGNEMPFCPETPECETSKVRSRCLRGVH